MNPTREEALFALALAKPAEKRAAFLGVMCEGDSGLRQRLEGLLAAHTQPGNLTPTQADTARPTLKLDLADAPDEAVGQTLGRYNFLERVGEGGCGVGRVAEQIEPVRRRLALKVIKLGMDFSPAKGELIESVQGHLNGAHGIAFSPDGRRLISASGGRETIKLWEVGTRQELLTLTGTGGYLEAATWSADGDVILVGTPWQAWRAPTWAEINAAEAKPYPCSRIGRFGWIFFRNAFVVRSLRIELLIRASLTPRPAKESAAPPLPSLLHGYG